MRDLAQETARGFRLPGGARHNLLMIGPPGAENPCWRCVFRFAATLVTARGARCHDVAFDCRAAACRRADPDKPYRDRIIPRPWQRL